MTFMSCFFHACILCGMFLTLKSIGIYQKIYGFSSFLLEKAGLCGLQMLCGYIFLERRVNSTEFLCFWIISLLLFIGWLDLRSYRIPNELVVALGLLSLIVSLDPTMGISLWQRILGFFLMSLPMCGVNRIYSGAFGGGDIKLLAVAGFLLGWSDLLVATFGGSCLAAGVCILLLVQKNINRKGTIAFGPYLCFGIIVVLLL